MGLLTLPVNRGCTNNRQRYVKPEECQIIMSFVFLSGLLPFFFSQTSIIYQDQESMVFLLLCPSNNVVLHTHGKIRTKTESGGGLTWSLPVLTGLGHIAPCLCCLHCSPAATAPGQPWWELGQLPQINACDAHMLLWPGHGSAR